MGIEIEEESDCIPILRWSRFGNPTLFRRRGQRRQNCLPHL